jgi:hypothetical protein
MNQKSKNALMRYLTKLDKGDPNVPEDGEIDPTYMEVEKILDYREEEVEEVVDDLVHSNQFIKDLELKVQTEIIKEMKENEEVSSNAPLSKSSSVANLQSGGEDSNAIGSRSATVTSTYFDEEQQQTVTKTPSQIFNPVERCRHVLTKIMEDAYAISFIDPVDTKEFDDYLEIVEEPICLSDVETKLDNGEYNKYNQYKQFAQDMRKIWRNCKLYNVYKSPIWHSANYLSMLFERLFQAWVTSFSDGTIPLSNAIARPWEPSCRVCLKDENDEQTILCDHCDATYHTYCLKPPLAKIPEDAWMCTRCLKWLARTGSKVLSNTVEEEARALVDGATFKKVIRVKKKKYLVKWRGLSYKECTWETAEDIKDDEKIAEYHKLNDSPPEEPPLTQAEIGVEIAKDRKTILYPAGVNRARENPVTDLDGEIYAQIRGFHFLKWNKAVPPSLLNEAGPFCFGYAHGEKTEYVLPKAVADVVQKLHLLKNSPEEQMEEVEDDNTVEGTEDTVSIESKILLDEELKQQLEAKEKEKKTTEEDDHEDKKPPLDKTSVRAFHPEDSIRSAVVNTLSDMMFAVARDHEKCPMPAYPTRQPLPSRFQAPSEVEICVPKGPGGLCIRIGNFRENVIVLGFKTMDNRGTKGPVERTGRIKAGDFLVGINGDYVYNLKFTKIASLLNCVRTPYVYLRFLRLPACVEGKSMNLVMEYFDKKLAFHPVDPRPSYRLPLTRSLYFGVFPSPSVQTKPDEEHHHQQEWVASYYNENFTEVIIGHYREELEAAKAYDRAIRDLEPPVVEEPRSPVDPAEEEKEDGEKEEKDEEKKQPPPPVAEPVKKSSSPPKPQRQLNFDKTGELTEQAKVLHKVVTAEREYASSIRLPEYKKTAKDEEKKRRLSSFQTGDNFDDYHSDDSFDTISDLSSDDERPENEDDDDEYKDEEDEEEEDDEDDDELVDDDDDDDEDGGGRKKKSKQSHQHRPSKKDEEEEDEEEAEEESEEKTTGRRGRKKKEPNWKRGKSTYEPEGPISRLLRAVNQSEYPPIKADWAKYILELAVERPGEGTPLKVMNRSRKIEQIDMVSSQVLRVWPGIIHAARSINVPTAEIFAVLVDKKDSAGGFKWKYAPDSSASAVGEAVPEEEEDYEEEKRDTSWQLKLPTKSKEYKSGGTLRDYQVEGLNWLLRCWYMKRSSILADEMGLGKTVQVVTMLDHLFEVEHIHGPFLVCVPLSTIGHWRREIEGWSHMQGCVYHDIGGGRDMRDVIREYDWYYKGRSRRLLKFHVLITTYDDLTRDYEELAEIPWRVVVVDEAHRLRNVNSKLLECMRTVATKGQAAYGYQHRILMTGTPLQNNTIELWSLLNFIEPAKFPDLEKFQQKYGRINTQEQVESLQRRIGPHLLRRVKEDVAKDIPPKEETIIDVELTTMQKQYYRAIFEHNHSFLIQNLKGNVPKLMNIQMELRKCCNHPFLIAGIEQIEMENLEKNIEEAAEKLSASARSKLLFDQKEFERKRMDEVLIPSSGKMVLLDKLLPKLRKEGHKVLIFSQMVRMIDIIEEYCEQRVYPVFRLDGRVSGNDRQKSIDKFNKDPNAFIFLLSTRAGGVGINLTAADTVIIFDSDWNPQNDIQAMARCHRIGQSKNVKIYRLITRRSFEADMFERASKKLGLEQAVLGTRNFNEIDWDDTNPRTGTGNNNSAIVPTSNVNMDPKEMERLLREGAYSLLIEDDGEMMKEFFEQDIDQILLQRTHVLVESAPQQTESWLNKRKKSSRTNKRMFTGDSAREHAEIDVNDPDFWKKVLPDLVTPESMLERLKDDSLEHDDEENRENIDKFMKDLSQMMEGMLDLSRRNQLPEHERAVCLKLLLRVTLKDELFDEDEIYLAKDWLQLIEGTRSRRSRQDIYKVEDPRASANKKKHAEQNKKRKTISTPGKRGRPKYVSDDDDLDEDDLREEDDDLDEEDDEEEVKPKKKQPQSKKATQQQKNTPKSSASAGKSTGKGKAGSSSGTATKKAATSTGKRSTSAKKYHDDDDEEDNDDHIDRLKSTSRGHGSDDEEDEQISLKRKRTRKPSVKTSATSSSSYFEDEVALEEESTPLPKKRQRKPKKVPDEDDEEAEEAHLEDEEDFGPSRKRSKSSAAETPSSAIQKRKRTPKPK